MLCVGYVTGIELHGRLLQGLIQVPPSNQWYIHLFPNTPHGQPVRHQAQIHVQYPPIKGESTGGGVFEQGHSQHFQQTEQ
jgi:hypothetical protein